jgi:hypothetical protein
MKSVLEDVPFFSTLNDYMTSASSARALDAGAIIGIVFGSVIGFVIFVFIVVACFIGCTVGFGVLVGGGGRWVLILTLLCSVSMFPVIFVIFATYWQFIMNSKHAF